MSIANKKSFKAVAFILLIGCILIGMVFAAASPSTPFDDIPVNSPQDASAFLQSIGWSTDPATAVVQESLLPTAFDETFNAYNALQLEQGCDLTDYAGKPITVYTLSVINYPNYDGQVLATVIVCNSTVIGGDIHAAKLDGFMHGLR